MIILVQQGVRKVPVQYARRIVGRKVYGGQNTYLPLKINTAGVIPIIFAQSIILFQVLLQRFLDRMQLNQIYFLFAMDHWFSIRCLHC